MGYTAFMSHPTSAALLSALNQAMRPGDFLDASALPDLLTRLTSLVESTAALAAEAGPEIALPVYEVFIGACFLKLLEINDPDGALSSVVEPLFCGWLSARQRAGHPAEDNLAIIDRWQAADDYGLLLGLEDQLIEALDEEGLACLEARALAILDAHPRPARDTPRPLRTGPQWTAATQLQAIYFRRGDAEHFEAISRRMGLTSDDCARLAGLVDEQGDQLRALALVEEGLVLAQRTLSAASPVSRQLAEHQRRLFLALGRQIEAIALAWGTFDARPDLEAFTALMQCVSEADRLHWQQHALDRAEQSGLKALFEIGLYVEDLDRLATRVMEAGPDVIARLSHFSTEPVADALAEQHPEPAALIYRSLALRILEADKSSWYGAAVEHLHQARACYLRAGQAGVWQALVGYIRRAHGQKHAFMAGFKRVLQGTEPVSRMPFLERAREQWEALAR